MASKPSLRDTVDLDAVAAVVDDDPAAGEEAGVLGKLVFYAIGDTIRVTLEELAALFEHYGIDKRFLPKEINPASVATAVLGGFGEEIELDDRKYELAFHVEAKVDGAIEAPMVRTRRRTNKERAALARGKGPGTDWQSIPEWDVVTVATVVWDPEEPEELPHEVEPDHVDEYAYEPFLEMLVEAYDEKRRFYGGSQVSAAVSKILNETMSIRTRPTGGVWLVPRDAMDLLDRVEQLVRLLDAEYKRELPEGKKTPPPTEFDSIILVDREKNRLFVQDKVEGRILADLADAIEKLMGMVAAEVAPRPTDLAAAAEMRRKALAYRDGFATVVSGGSDRMARALGDFDRAYTAALAIGEGT